LVISSYSGSIVNGGGEMALELKYYVDNGREKESCTSEVDMWPDSCPLCHHSIKAIGITGMKVEKTGNDCLEMVFQCPRHECRSLFLSYYKRVFSAVYEFGLIGSVPTTDKKRDFESDISEISEEFPVIYNQAKRSEEMGLDRVAGMGYRRAFEFLIKDYLIFELPEKEPEIKRKMLGTCIKDYITDERIKQIAERAAWLGNDETHYERRWVDKDIEDLKKLIEITVHFITMERLASRYINEMQ